MSRTKNGSFAGGDRGSLPPERPVIDNRREQQLISLIGRVEELENKVVDLSPYSLLSYVDKLFPLSNTAITTNTDVVLRHVDPSLVIVDSIGIERTVNLPGASKGNRFFIIINNSNP